MSHAITTYADIGEDDLVRVEIQFDYTPEYKGSYHDPPYPEAVEITEMRRYNGEEIDLDSIDDEKMNEIECLCSTWWKQEKEEREIERAIWKQSYGVPYDV